MPLCRAASPRRRLQHQSNREQPADLVSVGTLARHCPKPPCTVSGPADRYRSAHARLPRIGTGIKSHGAGSGDRVSCEFSRVGISRDILVRLNKVGHQRLIPIDIPQTRYNDAVRPTVHYLFEQKMRDYLFDSPPQFAHPALDHLDPLRSRGGLCLAEGPLSLRCRAICGVVAGQSSERPVRGGRRHPVHPDLGQQLAACVLCRRC